MTTNLVGTRLGEFEIVRELGRGGMGVVYESLQTSLNRRVALKVLGPGLGLTPRAVDRFRREAEAAARLHHSNIVPVYATGEERGVHFYAMELIDGPSLDAVIRQMRGGEAADTKTELPADLAATGAYTPAATSVPAAGSDAGSSSARFDRAAAMIADAADALHHAHTQGVTHRDVKPSNLLLSSDARLSVTDFGLARILEQPGMTVTGEFVGTPAYMSPEQITAGRIPVDHRTDIYSLGATLYELLTLRPPFVGEGRDQLLAQVIQKEPASPRALDSKIPRDLETIALKCLEKDPDRRYQTAKDLADDLRRYVNRFAIQAKRAGPLMRVRKWVKRNPALSMAGLVLLLALTAAGFFAWRAETERQQRIADEHKREEEVRAERKQTAMDKAIVEAMSGDAPSAFQAIAEAERLGAEPGQLNLLRGLVALQYGRVKEAFTHLELANQQLPDSVAAKALLASSRLAGGLFVPYTDLIVEAERLGPNTPEDFIFLGQSLAVMDARRGLETLDRAPPRQTVPGCPAVSGDHSGAVRSRDGNGRGGGTVLRDIDRADMPDNPLLMSAHVEALLAAAHAAGSDLSAEAYRNQAAALVARLARFPDHPIAVQGRCYFFLVTGDDDGILRVLQESGRQNEGNHTDFYPPYVLYRRKLYEEALKAAHAGRSAGSVQDQISQVILLATMRRTDEARQVLQQALDIPRAQSVAVLFGFWYLLGPKGEIDPVGPARYKLAKGIDTIPDWRGGWYRDLLRYNAGELTTEELIAKAGGSRMNQCEGFFYAGLHKLHERKRSEAKEWFQKSVDTGVFIYDEYLWSRAFLACIDDPKWMPWLDEKK